MPESLLFAFEAAEQLDFASADCVRLVPKFAHSGSCQVRACRLELDPLSGFAGAHEQRAEFDWHALPHLRNMSGSDKRFATVSTAWRQTVSLGLAKKRRVGLEEGTSGDQGRKPADTRSREGQIRTRREDW